MNRFAWGLLSLALLVVAGAYADEKKDEKAQQPPRRPGAGGDRPNVSSLLQFPRTGGGPLLSEKEMEELKLDAKQKEKVSQIVKDYEAKAKDSQDAIRKVFEDLRGGGGDREKIQEAIQKLRDGGTKTREEFEGKLTSVLNDDQKKKFDELKKARPQRGPGGGGFPFQPGGGFPGRGGAFTPGQILPPGSKDRLELNDDQKKKIEELEKKVKDELNKILTDDQKKKLEQPGGRPGFGRPGTGDGNRPNRQPGQGGRPGGAGGRPRPDGK
jgi:Spy/CpxP family protein refolding chaperone